MIRSSFVTNRFCFSQKTYFPLCKLFWVTIKYKCMTPFEILERTEKNSVPGIYLRPLILEYVTKPGFFAQLQLPFKKFKTPTQAFLKTHFFCNKISIWNFVKTNLSYCIVIFKILQYLKQEPPKSPSPYHLDIRSIQKSVLPKNAGNTSAGGPGMRLVGLRVQTAPDSKFGSCCTGWTEYYRKSCTASA